MAQTRSVAYQLVSYTRLYDYGERNADDSATRFLDTWTDHNLKLHIVLDDSAPASTNGDYGNQPVGSWAVSALSRCI